ncbi:hypothetical protein OAT25_01140 [Candidatus Pelagibacter sp.]|nr:hypothetical protein [Candidatus Pelagibacter sp.]
MLKDLKIFFIKLLSVLFSIIIILNVTYNLYIHDRLKKLDKLLLMDRDNFQNKLRKEINYAIENENLLSIEDKKLLKRLYEKIRSEFENLED